MVSEQNVAWCQPMDCGKNTPRKFIVRFEDAERGDAVFDDEAEAREFFERANSSWNCYLFGSLPRHPEAAEARATAAEAQVARIEAETIERLPGAIADIAAERQRQIEAEGWTPEHDDQHATGEIAGAAACYALTGVMHWVAPLAIKKLWPWDDKWWKPAGSRRDLVKAGALIIAEIERLDRAALRALTQEPHDAK